MKKTFAYALLVLTALYSCEEGKQEEPVLPGTTPDEIYLKRFASCTHFRRNRRVEEYHNCQYKYELESNSG